MSYLTTEEFESTLDNVSILSLIHISDRDWNLYGLSPLRQALHSNRWKQPELEQAASEFLWGKYLSNDPLEMYVAFRIWNSYLLAREPLTE